MKLILTGATGFLGAEVLRQALASPTVEHVTVLGRQASGVNHSKLTDVVVQNFLDYSGIGANLRADACVWCLGVSQTAVGKAEYIKVTFDYAMAAARAMFAATPQLRFCFVSGRSADREERHFTLQGNIKGRTERELSKLSPNVFSFRPALILQSRPDEKRPFGLKMIQPLARLLDRVSDKVSVDTATLAGCLLDVASRGANTAIIDNPSIRHWAQSAA